MIKSWPARHPFLSSLLILVVFACLAITLGKLVNSLYFLLLIPGFALYAAGFYIFEHKYAWICSKCEKESWRREKYCRYCGEEIILARAKILMKYCEKEHRIEDEYDLAGVCPKCGKPFVKEIVELK